MAFWTKTMKTVKYQLLPEGRGRDKKMSQREGNYSVWWYYDDLRTHHVDSES